MSDLLPVPRRVLMTADPIGGVWTYMIELVRGLVGVGVEVLVASLGGPVSESQRAAFATLGPRALLRVSTRKLEWMDRPWSDVAADGECLLELEREFRPDLVHLNGYAHAALPWGAPVLVVAHSCVYSWWQAVHGSAPPAAEWLRYHEAVSAGLRAADLVVAPSRAMLRQLSLHYLTPASALVIPNGRENASAPEPSPTREPVILGVGRLWDEAKNLRALAAVAPAIPWPVRLAGAVRAPGGGSRRTDIPVRLPGDAGDGRDGEYDGDGRETAFRGVELLGVLSEAELARHYARAGIFAAPALYEPFGLSILEAAQAGCALVLGDIRSLRENWDGAALFADPRDPVALADALRELIARPGLRRELAVEAGRRAAAFTPARMRSAYLAAYGRLLSLRTRNLVPA